MFSIPERKNCDKVKTKKALYEMLNKYKEILSKETIEYLKALIDLDISVYNQDISEHSREVLNELELYRKVAVYNIYKRTEKLLKENSNGIDMEFYENQNVLSKLSAKGKIDDSSFCIFDFDYSMSSNNKRLFLQNGLDVSDYAKKLYIGDSFLYLTKDNPELREEELLRVLGEYEKESNKKNPYSIRRKVYGGPAPMWDREHRHKLANLEKQFKTLDEHKELSQTEKQIIQAQQYFYDLLLENFGLNSDDFSENDCRSSIRNQEDKMHKTLVKKYPGMKIITHINNL